MSLVYYFDPLNRKSFTIKWPKPANGFQSIYEEYLFLQTQVTFPASYFSLDFIKPVIFLTSKSDSETTTLCKKYKQQKKMLTKIYSQGDVLDITFKKLCSD